MEEMIFEPLSSGHYSERLPRPVIPLRHLDEVSRPFYQIQSTFAEAGLAAGSRVAL